MKKILFSLIVGFIVGLAYWSYAAQVFVKDKQGNYTEDTELGIAIETTISGYQKEVDYFNAAILSFEEKKLKIQNQIDACVTKRDVAQASLDSLKEKFATVP